MKRDTHNVEIGLVVVLGKLISRDMLQYEKAYSGSLKVTTHSNNRNSKSSREVILGSVRL